MKCPLIMTGVQAFWTQPSKQAGECLEGKCAWWYPAGGCCSLRSIALDLSYLERHTRELGPKQAVL